MSFNPIIGEPSKDTALLNNQIYNNYSNTTSTTQFLNALPVVQTSMSRDISSVFTPALHIQRMKLPANTCQCRLDGDFCWNCCCGVDITTLINLTGPNYLQQFNAHETSDSCANGCSCLSNKVYSTTTVNFGHDASGPQSFKYEKFSGPVPDPIAWCCLCPCMLCLPYTKEVKVYDSNDNNYLGSLKRGRRINYCVPHPQGPCCGKIFLMFSNEIVHADGMTSYSITNLRAEKLTGEDICGCCPNIIDQWFEADIVESNNIDSKNFVGKSVQRFHIQSYGKHHHLVLSPILDLTLPQNATPTDKAIFMAASLLEMRIL